jgi:hypothetical protein
MTNGMRISRVKEEYSFHKLLFLLSIPTGRVKMWNWCLKNKVFSMCEDRLLNKRDGGGGGGKGPDVFPA